MPLTAPDLWISRIRLFNSPHDTGANVYRLCTIRGLGTCPHYGCTRKKTPDDQPPNPLAFHVRTQTW